MTPDSQQRAEQALQNLTAAAQQTVPKLCRPERADQPFGRYGEQSNKTQGVPYTPLPPYSNSSKNV